MYEEVIEVVVHLACLVSKRRRRRVVAIHLHPLNFLAFPSPARTLSVSNISDIAMVLLTGLHTVMVASAIQLAVKRLGVHFDMVLHARLEMYQPVCLLYHRSAI